MADNEIRLNVTAVESEPLNVCVTQTPMNPVNVENTYKGIDYNLLKNKPSIDGVPLEGDKTTAEVIGFDKEYVDDAILATNAKIDSVEQNLSDRIEAVSSREGYSKEEIDNKVIVIEADIDANADAIQKTRSDFMESDSELQQQINAHAEELTTQKNDIDELGDQVAGIESKIPEGTSDTNPLINKQQLLDEEMDLREDMMESDSELQTQINALADAIQGGGAGPSGETYTKDNLIGGKGVEIVPESTGGGKDEHTLALWHLDTDVIDSVNGIALQYPSTLSITSGIFGGCVQNYSNTHANDISVLGLTSSDSWTMDFWLKYNTYKSSGVGDYGLGSTFYGTTNALTIGFYRYELRLSGIGWGDARNTTIKTFAGSSTPWSHMAIQYDAENKIGSVFVDGEPVYEGAVTIADGDLFSHMALQNGPGVLFDEIRISNTLRYSGKFTPPTEPYSEPVLTGRSFINNTAGKNIGEVFYSQSNSATDNAGALPLFTGETIANADALYPDFFSWVSSHSELQTTAEEYEAELLSRGDCNKYVVDGTSVRLPKKTLDKRYLIESKYPTETDSSWYNLYSDGWIEQGGRVSSATENADFVVTLTKPMLNNRYCIQRTSASASTTTASFRSVSVKGITTTEFKMYITDTISPTYWYVCGQSSITPQDKVDYPWVQAYNYAVPASSAQAAEFQEGLSGKADTNLGNTEPSASFKANSVSWCMPDYSSYTTLTTAQDFTAPIDGWLSFYPGISENNNVGWNYCFIKVDGQIVNSQAYKSGTNGVNADGFMCPVGKGSIVEQKFNAGRLCFYACKGEI